MPGPITGKLRRRNLDHSRSNRILKVDSHVLGKPLVDLPPTIASFGNQNFDDHTFHLSFCHASSSRYY